MSENSISPPALSVLSDDSAWASVHIDAFEFRFLCERAMAIGMPIHRLINQVFSDAVCDWMEREQAGNV